MIVRFARIIVRWRSYDSAFGPKKQEMKHCVNCIIPRLEKRNVVVLAETLYSLAGAHTLFDIIESTITPAEDGDDYKYSVDSVQEWDTKLKEGLSRCLSLPEEYIHTMTDYLLFVQEEKNRQIPASCFA